MPRGKAKGPEPISTAQAKIMARKLSKDGKTYEEIGQELAKQGVNGPRSGKPLSISTLSAWLAKPEKAEKSEKASKPEKVVKRRQMSARAPSAGSHVITTIKAVLEFKGIEPAETLNLIRALVENA